MSYGSLKMGGQVSVPQWHCTASAIISTMSYLITMVHEQEERRKHYTLAALIDVWEMFLDGLHFYRTPAVDMTVDEQLIPVNGKCPLRQSMPTSQPRMAPRCAGITVSPLHNH